VPSFSPTDTATGARWLEQPSFFESAGRPLYGVYHAPERAAGTPPVVVHVHGYGVEQMALYRVEVLMARTAAAAGLPVLRYHMRGHGDSSGDFADVTLEGMIEDAMAAAAEARRRSGAAGIVWLGIRLGGLVAAEAMTRRSDTAGLVLWEPVHRPLDYFRGLLRGMLFSQVAQGRTPDASVDQLLERVEREGRTDVHGYYLHRAAVESTKDRTLETPLAAWAGPTLVAQIQGRPRFSPANRSLEEALRARGAAVTTLCVNEEPGWHFSHNPAWECPALVDGTAAWLRSFA
jgi:pimeloyl-ACP methyl ester carboxylesterase